MGGQGPKWAVEPYDDDIEVLIHNFFNEYVYFTRHTQKAKLSTHSL
jgi:hypothetical protein